MARGQTRVVPTTDLCIRDLYLQLATSRATSIEQVLKHTVELPEPPAETLAIAAAALANVDCHARRASLTDSVRAAGVARRLTGEARKHDMRATLFAERALLDLEHSGPTEHADLLQEAADSLLWASAVLVHLAGALEHTDDGNVEQLELAWLCLAEGAELLAASDLARAGEREAGI